MKKLIPFLFIMMLLLSSCSTGIENPVLPASFNQRARVSTGDFSYECEICKNEKELVVTVLSTNAQGMVMRYDGSNMNFSFKDMTGDVSSDALPKVNAVLLLYEALEYIYTQDMMTPSTVNEGYRYQGKTSLGDFVLVTDKDGRLTSFEIPSTKLRINKTPNDS